MSEPSISRWKSISMERPANHDRMKRSSLENEELDDDASLVSRSPSLELESMDVDPDTYREHVRGPAREIITVETRIRPENRGFALLARMGWSEGQPLGLSGDGRVDPIPFQLKNDSTGIGKITQDIRMIETTVSQRKGLEVERQQKETEVQRKARQELVARKAAVEDEISSVLRAFYCELCDKQFKNVAQYDEHTNSYGHHHKARLRDMNANARPTSRDDVGKRKEKERRREEKELRKMAAAAGVKMPKVAAQAQAAAPAFVPPSDPMTPSSAQSGTASESSKPQNGGWATASVPASQPGTVKKSGWATVGSVPQAPTSGPSPRPAAVTGAQSTSTASSHTTSGSHTSSAPAFRNAGWTSLDTGGPQQVPSQSPPSLAALPIPPYPPPIPSQDSRVSPQAPLPSLGPTTGPASTTVPTAAPHPHRPSGGGGWKQFQSSMKTKGRR